MSDLSRRHGRTLTFIADPSLSSAAGLAAIPQEDLWRDYQLRPGTATRQALLEGYLSLIRFVAVKVASKLPGCVDVNDLLQEGFLGLDRAIDAFDPNRGVQFSTFAVKRIWGAMMDGLRAEDWQRRTHRRRTQRLEHARRELMSQTGRPPTGEEIAARLGISTDEFERLWGAAEPRGLGSLHSAHADDGFEGRWAAPEDPRAGDPAAAAIREDLKELLTRGFTRAERLIVILYYYEDMTMREIGETLDISESRVSQLHSLLVKRIRSVIHAWDLQ